MKKLILLILLFKIKSALSGSQTNCGTIYGSFMPSLQVTNADINKFSQGIKDAVTSFGGHAIALDYYCRMMVSVHELEIHTSELVGVEASYIHGIFNGSINQPFPSPVSCIGKELLSIYDAIKVISPIALEKDNFVSPPKVDPSASCSDIYQDIHAFLLSPNIRIPDPSKMVKEAEKLPNSMQQCKSEAFTYGISTTLSVNESAVNNYLADVSAPVTRPLSCFKDGFEKVNLINKTTIENMYEAVVTKSMECADYIYNLNPIFHDIETGIRKFLNTTIYAVTSYPKMGHSFIEYFYCHQDAAIDIVIDGASRLTGVDQDYIEEIINGTISPPFESPMDCIEGSLMSFNSFLLNIHDNVIPKLKNLIKQSTVNPNASCPQIIRDVARYYGSINDVAGETITTMLAVGELFNASGHSDLYLSHAESHYTCKNSILAHSLAEYLNINQNLVNNYFRNSTARAPHPLSCITDIIKIAQSTINSANNLIDSIIIAPVAPIEHCEPFYYEFRAYQRAWYKYVGNLQNFAIASSAEHPELVSMFVTDLECELNAMIVFAANATSLLSKVDSEVILSIINGTATGAFKHPLDCVVNDLLVMKRQISTLFNTIIPGLHNFALASNSSTENCSMTYQSLTKYTDVMVLWLKTKEPLIKTGTEMFRNVNFLEMYLDSLASITNCQPMILGAFVGAALNIDSDPVINFLSAGSMTLPDPFSCVKIIIKMYNNMFSDAMINFMTQTPLVIEGPEIPSYNEQDSVK